MPQATRHALTRSHVIAIAAATLFAALIVAVTAAGDGPIGPDAAVRDWVVDHRTRGWIDTFQAIADSGNRVVPHLLAALAGALVVPRAWPVGALVGAGALVAGQLIRYTLVNTLDRPRPPAAEWTTHVSNPSLPSGHATTAALTAIGLAAALLPHCHRRVTRALAVAVPAAWAVAVGASRLVLGVHWFSDVVAGWLLATVMTALALPPLGRALGARSQGPTRAARP
ncbi:phosphatase PAP2 family protein [Streptomyces sp. SBT349]|uniref:phosphatase PAP2 family protein n=1 Tax=Streptomyces sp. SBT349 TaxID=1580539 RepID=UPI00066CB612|nr:phosphatase PAP2 family protein [Streptomyces sp. SBT349]